MSHARKLQFVNSNSGADSVGRLGYTISKKSIRYITPFCHPLFPHSSVETILQNVTEITSPLILLDGTDPKLAVYFKISNYIVIWQKVINIQAKQIYPMLLDFAQ